MRNIQDGAKSVYLKRKGIEDDGSVDSGEKLKLLEDLAPNIHPKKLKDMKNQMEDLKKFFA